MNPPICKYEREAAEYFSDQLSGTKLAEVENHIAECAACCQTLAELTKLMSAEISEEENAFLSATVAESAKTVSEIVKQSLAKELEANKMANNSNVVWLNAHQTKQSKYNSKGLANWKASQLAIAASIAIAFLVGVIAIYQLSSTTNKDNHSIAQSRAYIEEINRTGRPTKLRFADLDYAAEAQTRGNESEELKKKISASRYALEGVVQNDPRPANRQLLAQVLLIAGDNVAAVEQLSQAAITDNNNSPSILNDLAVAQAAESDYKSALESINKALAIDQNYLEAIFNRALIHHELNEDNNARSDWEKYLKLDPNSPWAKEAKEQLNSIK
jgi:tetratricopeptide (TPR) repeat protein